MKTYIIPVFIPHYGCPHTCNFCSQKKITGVETDVSPAVVEHMIQSHLQGITKPYFIEVAFYGGSFTALPLSLQRSLLEPAFRYIKNKKIHAIRLSTRPDAIDDTILQQLQQLGVKTIELGAQSFDDQVLALAERGHTAAMIHQAASKIHAFGFTLGIQLMPGLLGDRWRSIVHSLLETLRIRPELVRIYPVIVLEGTRLGELYKEGRFTPLSMEKAVQYAAMMKLFFMRAGIRVIRTGLQASETLDDGKTILAGPYHPAFGEMTDAWLFYLMGCRIFEQVAARGETLVLHHAPEDASRIRGNKNTNTIRWKEKYGWKEIVFCGDLVGKGQMTAETAQGRYRMNLDLLQGF